MSDKAFNEWVNRQSISLASPETYWAEQGWNAALRTAKTEMAVHRGMEWEADVLDEYITVLKEDDDQSPDLSEF